MKPKYPDKGCVCKYELICEFHDCPCPKYVPTNHLLEEFKREVSSNGPPISPR